MVAHVLLENKALKEKTRYTCAHESITRMLMSIILQQYGLKLYQHASKWSEILRSSYIETDTSLKKHLTVVLINEK